MPEDNFNQYQSIYTILDI